MRMSHWPSRDAGFFPLHMTSPSQGTTDASALIRQRTHEAAGPLLMCAQALSTQKNAGQMGGTKGWPNAQLEMSRFGCYRCHQLGFVLLLIC